MSMHIVDKSLNITTEFEDLKIEDIFKYDGRIFMKLSDECENNSYDFSKHRLTSFTEDSAVQYVQSELILHHVEWSR